MRKIIDAEMAWRLHADEGLSWRRVAQVMNGLCKTNFQPASYTRAVRDWKREHLPLLIERKTLTRPIADK